MKKIQDLILTILSNKALEETDLTKKVASEYSLSLFITKDERIFSAELRIILSKMLKNGSINVQAGKIRKV